MEDCECHKMELIAGREICLWDENDIMFMEYREIYECEYCGVIETFAKDFQEVETTN